MQVNNHDLQAQLRFESFKLGQPRPTHTHARSHSRNTSMSSIPFTSSKSTPVGLSDLPPSKRNSHHRRRSSVSTRRESAEMMGIAIPDLPQSGSEENINLGDKDSIRRRALWALEGKSDPSYSKVEIPELPSDESKGADFPSKPSFPPGPGLNSALSSLMPSKRDSFKLLGSGSSSKDQLGTLLEEDEDEDETLQFNPSPLRSSPSTRLSSRPRPATLRLRPLSLTPDVSNSGLPTPPSTCQTHPRLGLRSLSLCDGDVPPAPVTVKSQKPALNLQITSDGSLVKPFLRDEKPSRRSSIGYKRSSSGTGLPTPEMTPTFDSRRSPISLVDDDDASSISSVSSRSQTRPLSASEQHFLFKSHNALLMRIMDLERCLSSRRESFSPRPSSVLSDISNSSVSDDEMMRLVSDLKAERDELKRDVEGWRERVGEMDKQLIAFSKRAENERKEAWVARAKCGMVEVERDSLAKEVADLNTRLSVLQGETRLLEDQLSCLSEEKKVLEAELARLKASQSANEAFPFRSKMSFPDTLGYVSPLDSSSTSSSTIIDSEDSAAAFSLKSITKESADTPGYFSDEDNGLAGYEDEDENDVHLVDVPSSDNEFDSDDSFPRSVHEGDVKLPLLAVKTHASHQAHASLSKTWSFPRGPNLPRLLVPENTSEVDKFFSCLEEDDDVSPIHTNDDDLYSFERSKGLFASGFKYEAGVDTPAWLTSGTVIQEEGLNMIPELEEDNSETTKVEVDDDDDAFAGVSGIKFTFTPPSDDPVENETPKPTDSAVPSSFPVTCSPKSRFEPLPGFDIEEEEDEVVHSSNPPSTPPKSNASSIFSSPSAIPRPIISRSLHGDSPAISYSLGSRTPPKIRGTSSRSFIPQSVSPKIAPSTTFMRQPIRKLQSHLPADRGKDIGKSLNGSPSTNSPMTYRRSQETPRRLPRRT